jgi:hypothetical protein
VHLEKLPVSKVLPTGFLPDMEVVGAHVDLLKRSAITGTERPGAIAVVVAHNGSELAGDTAFWHIVN